MHKNETSNTARVRKWYIFSVHCTMFRQDRDLKRQRIITYDTNVDDGISCLTNRDGEGERERKREDYQPPVNWGSENCDASDNDDESVELHDDYVNLSESFDLSKNVLCNHTFECA